MSDLKPGRELDGLVAEKVMGWRRPDADRTFQPWHTGEHVGEHSPYGLPVSLPHFSLDIGAAFKVIEHLVSSRLNVGFTLGSRNGTWAIGIGHRCSAVAETAPHAICLAALKMVDKGPVFSCEGDCWSGDCSCRDLDGSSMERAPMPPLHEGCACVVQAVNP